ncbi:TIGR01620 family protein [Rhodobacteraceae bacterium M382]|nr:TIGR01620 family protein [Rhodobacteraceae bacterium M382]
MSKGPVLFDLDESDDTPEVDVAAAPPVPDLNLSGRPDRAGATTVAMQMAGTRPSRLARWFWGLLVSIILAAVGVAAWDFAVGLLDRWPVLGWAVAGAIGVLLGLAVAISVRELAALARLRRVETLRTLADAAVGDVAAARAFGTRLSAFYQGRSDQDWGRARWREHADQVLDADALLDLAETELLAPLDRAALIEIERAARQVATVTALVPLALADVVAVLLNALRMTRAIAQIYGGRSGLFGSWRLLRAVLAHLAATGAVAIGDDLLESVLGGSVLAKLSRRFGEGVVNGALTARVGIAAMEVCRPMPFSKPHRPKVKSVIKRALVGLFDRSPS